MTRSSVNIALVAWAALLLPRASATTWYVATNGNDAAAGTNWATAKQTIQAAVDLAVSNDTVLVSNGVYATGGRVNLWAGGVPNRVVVTNRIAVQSVHGPAATVIQGAPRSGQGTGETAVRCACVGNGSILSGFTLCRGGTLDALSFASDDCGAGAWCEPMAVLSNCILEGNTSVGNGGGCFRGLLYDCTLLSNTSDHTRVPTAWGGGAYLSTLTRCTLSGNRGLRGGGAAYCTLTQCTLSGNTALLTTTGGSGEGGAAKWSQLTACIVASNSGAYGAGINACTARLCTIVGNVGTYGGASYGAALSDCELLDNRAHAGGGAVGGALSNCTLAGNVAVAGSEAWDGHGGGAGWAVLDRCSLTGNSAVTGGGDEGSTLRGCVLAGNVAVFGGGSASGTLNNCVLAGNTAATNGGGAVGAVLNNCTVADNTASNRGGGVFGGEARNCVVVSNRAPAGANHTGTTFVASCTTPHPGGEGTITNDPQFVNAAAGNYRLAATSPCVNRGSNAYVQGAADLDGRPRILSGRVDLGAYEFAPYWAWTEAIQDGRTNFEDCAAGDGYPNLLKFATGSSPTNADSLAAMGGGRTGGVLYLTFHRNTNATDVTLIVEGARTITNETWSGLATNRFGSWGGAPNVFEAGATSPVRVTAYDSAGSATTRFMRLRVTWP